MPKTPRRRGRGGLANFGSRRAAPFGTKQGGKVPAKSRKATRSKS
jgi:hypothetical protein